MHEGAQLRVHATRESIPPIDVWHIMGKSKK